MSGNNILGVARTIFLLKKVTMLSASNAPQKKILRVGASCLVLISYLYLSKLVSGRYRNKYKCNELGGITITNRDVIRVTSRYQLFIFIKF